jgi:hypothetical protein
MEQQSSGKRGRVERINFIVKDKLYIGYSVNMPLYCQAHSKEDMEASMKNLATAYMNDLSYVIENGRFEFMEVDASQFSPLPDSLEFDFTTDTLTDNKSIGKEKPNFYKSPVEKLQKEIEFYKTMIVRLQNRQGIDPNAAQSVLDNIIRRSMNAIEDFERAIQLLQNETPAVNLADKK